MKKFIALLLALLMVFSLAACASGGDSKDNTDTKDNSSDADTSKDNSASADSDKAYKIGWVNLSDNDENCYLATTTFADIVTGADFASAIGYDGTVDVITCDSQMDLETQTNLVENLITEGCDLIYLIGCDTEGNTVCVNACNDAGIPIFMVATTASGGDYTFVGWDEYNYGVYQANWAAENFPENAKVCYMDGTSGREAFDKREAGFKDVIAEKRPDIEIMSTQAAENTSAEEAMQITEDWITQYGDDIDAIVTQSNLTVLGVVEALKAAGMENDVIIVGGIHCGTWDVDLIREGIENYGVYVGFDTLGKLCADIAERWYKGETINSEEMIEFYDVTPDNINEYFPA